MILKSFSITTTISLFLLTMITGCQSGEPQQTTTSSSSPTPTTKPSAEVSINVPKKPLIVSPTNPETPTAAEVKTYLNRLTANGFSSQNQGIWIQSGDTLLANHQGTIPLPAASLTKVATSLVALENFGPDHQFITLISARGNIENGVLKGDLVIEGGEDPLFVWEEAIAIGNLLNQIGIQQVTGNLIITDKFYMNFEANPVAAGHFFKQALNSQNWPQEAAIQYQTLPPGTPRPQVVINGSVQFLPATPQNLKPLIEHSSFPLAELVKKMNQYSNNLMADMLANAVGGPQIVAQKAAKIVGVSPSEIQLINGSGLGEENRISPRAATGMFLAIDRLLQPYNMTVGDVFTIVGKDEGILEPREMLPKLSVVKSGTLNYVSALAGALPTRDKGIVWFAILNKGSNVSELRDRQEALLNTLLQDWGYVSNLPPELTPLPARSRKTSSSEVSSL
jgi:D-alanyl-D-alanine carboxypeptidase/D-alanyl-D-alanine-endopeptidase (penicillin-binding protein 4)